MKTSLSIIILSLVVNLAFSQETPNPEFTDIPYLWNKESNELTMPAKETADIKVSGMGTKSLYQFKGTNSTVKLQSSAKTSILINSSMPALLTAMKLYKLESKKKTREVEVASVGFGGADMKDENVIDFNSKNLSENIYEIVFTSQLQPGEYAFTNGMNSFTFSVE